MDLRSENKAGMTTEFFFPYFQPLASADTSAMIHHHHHMSSMPNGIRDEDLHLISSQFGISPQQLHALMQQQQQQQQHAIALQQVGVQITV